MERTIIMTSQSHPHATHDYCLTTTQAHEASLYCPDYCPDAGQAAQDVAMYEASLATLATLRHDQAVSREQHLALDAVLDFRCRQRSTSRAEFLAEFLPDGSGGPTSGQAVHEASPSLATLRHEPAFLSACEASMARPCTLPSQEVHKHLRHAPDFLASPIYATRQTIFLDVAVAERPATGASTSTTST